MSDVIEDLLLYLQNNDIINLDDVRMRKMVEEMQKKQILEKHPYEIFLSTDGRYHTYLMKDGKRKQIARKTKESIENAVVQYYREQENEKACTLKTLYPEWLDYKLTCSNSANNVKRIDNDWNRYYVGSKIIDIPLPKLDYLTVNSWAHTIIKKHSLTQKQFRNMAIIMKQALLYAVEKGIIRESPYERVKITGRIFASSSKKKSDTQVFLLEEQPQIEQEAFYEFYETGNPIALAIPFDFQTGLRVGELVALRYSDIEGDYLYVERSEVKEPLKTENGWGAVRYEIVDHAKTKAGTRKVYLTSQAKLLLDMIRKANLKNGWVDGDYIFVNQDGRVHARALDYRLRKYCENIGIPPKSMHKIRKTFISTLIDNNVNINYIRETVGHESEETTYKSYCYNRRTESETAKMMENALCGSPEEKVIKSNQKVIELKKAGSQ